MAASDEGIKQIDVRKKWRHEAYDFTPWLSDNLHVLGDALGLKLEPVRQEKQVGSFSLDILAREVNENVMVAIENQLEWTDHIHLGQLLTYAAGCDARIAIWVADEFQPEHAEALHKLNQWAGSNVRFYGLKVDVVQRPDSDELEPRFHRVVYPYGWDKALTLPWPPPVNPEIQQYKTFFGPLIATLMGPEMKFAASCRQAWWYKDRFFPSSFDTDIGYVASLQDRAYVYILIRTWDGVAFNNKLFDALKAQEQEIESTIDAQGNMYWAPFNAHSFSTIGFSRDASIDDSPEKLEETRTWMLDLLPKFKDVFEERVESLLTKLRTPHGNGPDQA